MSDHDSSSADSALFGDEPMRQVQRDGVEYTLLGTAHVSRTSAETVARLLESGQYDAVAIELCQSRFQAMTEQDTWRNLNLFSLLRQGKAGMMMPACRSFRQAMRHPIRTRVTRRRKPN